ncbi:MAG TPA: hypothetical protein VFE91_06930, partial [Nitrososphaerales archaeon]|nr:hypothetical protein [Nitrososphaerales archaeon]
MRRRGSSSTLIVVAVVAVAAGLAFGGLATYYLVYSPEVSNLNSKLNSIDDQLSTLQGAVSVLQVMAARQASNDTAIQTQLNTIGTELSNLNDEVSTGNLQTSAQLQAIQTQLNTIQKVLAAIQTKVGAVVYPPTQLSPTGFRDGTRDDYKHKVFFAAGRVWAFYQEASGYVGWKSSVNGSVWSPFTNLFFSNASASASDGTNALYDSAHNRVWVVSHLVYSGDTILYWHGTPNADGSISWAGPPQSELLNFMNPIPDAAIDSSGVMWNTATPGYQYPTNEVLIFRNGTYVSSLTLPGQYFAALADLVPASNGKMFAILDGGDFEILPLQIYYSTDLGRTWSAPVATNGSYNIDSSSAVSVGDTLYVAGGSTSGPVLFTYHLGAPSVGTETLLDSASS